jgi:2-methylcitrate dehydratase
LSAKTWGFYDVLFKGNAFKFQRPVRQLRHGERAVQDQLPGRVPRADRGRVRAPAPPEVAGRLDQIERIELETQEAGARIIDKTGRSRTTRIATTACSTWSRCR